MNQPDKPGAAHARPAPAPGDAPAAPAAPVAPVAPVAYWRAVQTASPAAIVGADLQGCVTSWSPAAERLFGRRSADMQGQPLVTLCLPGLEAELLRRLAALQPGAEPVQAETVWRHADGREVPLELWMSAVVDDNGQVLGSCLLARDLGAQREAEQLIWRQAHFDELTGLPNRRHFTERLEQALTQARARAQPLALLAIDLDHFKQVNDSLGHRAGDELLVQAAARIRHCLRGADEVGRQGGDEFTVLLPVLAHGEDVDTVCTRLGDALRQPFALGAETVRVSASIGVALFPPHGRSADELLAHADQAMYDAKQRGRDQTRRYTETMRLAQARRQRMVGELRQALDRNEMRVCYQPVIDRDGAPCGFEASLRWRHPVLGPVAAEDFLPLAEDTGLIRPLSHWMFMQGTQQLAAWRQRLGLDLSLSFGMSEGTLQELRQLIEAWKAQALRLAVPPSALVGELTEAALEARRPSTEAAVLALRAEGCRIAVRHFGSGRVHLADLQRLGVHQVKLAPTLVDGLGPSSPQLALADGITALAHRLGLKVVATGVTSARQIEWLQGIGCDRWQGPWISPPLDGEAADAWLQRWLASRRVAAGQVQAA